MKKQLLSIALICTLAITTFAGCGSKEGIEGMSKSQLIEAYKNQSAALEEIKHKQLTLEAEYNALTSGDRPDAIIAYVGDGNKKTFISTDAKIIFPETFKYPGAESVPVLNKINLTDKVTITPSSNWSITLNGTTFELQHTNGTSGIVKVGKVAKSYTVDELKADVLAPWFSGMINSGKITYSTIYIENSPNPLGVDAKVPIMIDSEDATLRCGMVYAGGDAAITYVFVYREQDNADKNEIIINTIQAIKYNGASLKIN